MIFELTKKVINDAIQRDMVTEAFKQSMMKKLDVFLLHNRITAVEYEELVNLLNNKGI